MAYKIAINGYGRIGRSVLRALYESHHYRNLEVVAINELAEAKTIAHLTKYDTTHGRFSGDVELCGNDFFVNNNYIKLTHERQMDCLPWADLGVDVVMECSGAFSERKIAEQHLKSGAQRVIFSHPAEEDVDATIVYGVNEETLSPAHTVISNASCTTNCLAPVAKVVNDTYGIKHGIMTTIHAYTNDQVLTDVFHSDLRRARSATMSQIPTKTGAAAAVGLVLPELDGKLDGFSMRVPTINVSAVDLSFVAARDTSVEEVNSILREASEGPLKGVLAYNDEPLVSIDFNHNPASSVFDAGLTKVMEGSLVKVVSWYDNEWGFSNRMLDTAVVLHNAS